MATTESGNRNIAAMTQENDEMLGGLLSMESHLAASLSVGSGVEYLLFFYFFIFLFFLFFYFFIFLNFFNFFKIF
jgi:hypothetical protein